MMVWVWESVAPGTGAPLKIWVKNRPKANFRVIFLMRATVAHAQNECFIARNGGRNHF